MATANQAYFDASLRHQIGIRRLAAGDAQTILKLLAKSDAELEAFLSKKSKIAFTQRRLRALVKDIRALRSEVFTTIRATSRGDLSALAAAEQEFSRRLLELAVPVQMDFAVASAATLRAAVISQPFAGGANAARTLQQWWKGVEAVDARRITDALQLGMVQSETVPQMVSRVRKATSITRANAETVVRTGVNHVSNVARESFFDANAGIAEAYKWTATLDGRTSVICRARDGHFAPAAGTALTLVPALDPPGARPPAHPSCRSIMIAILSQKGFAEAMPDRAFVRDTRTRRFREKDFRADARAKAGKRWGRMDPAARRRAIGRRKSAWTKENIGFVPADVNYDQWLRTQPVSFQNEVLGIRKGRAFRKGLKLDQFVDRRGTELTLKQLKTRYPDLVELR